MFGTIGGLGPGSLAHFRPRRQGTAGPAEGLSENIPAGTFAGTPESTFSGTSGETSGGTSGGTLAVDDLWLGRVIDPLGAPLDRRGPLPHGPRARPVRARPPPATLRAPASAIASISVSA